MRKETAEWRDFKNWGYV